MKNLIKLRKERNLTNKEVGDALGVSRSAYNHWEVGRCEPDIQSLIKLSDFFCVSIDYLVGHPAPTTSPANETLTRNEEELLTAFRALGIFEQGGILVQVKALAEQARAIKK